MLQYFFTLLILKGLTYVRSLLEKRLDRTRARDMLRRVCTADDSAELRRVLSVIRKTTHARS